MHKNNNQKDQDSAKSMICDAVCGMMSFPSQNSVFNAPKPTADDSQHNGLNLELNIDLNTTIQENEAFLKK